MKGDVARSPLNPLIRSFPAVILALVGCSSTQSHFDRILPEMTVNQVREAMPEGPSRFETLSGGGYSSWYWGTQYCVLFHDGRVVSKDSAGEGNQIQIGPGKYEERKNAQCLAPGQTATGVKERTINLPGAGTIHLPLTNNDISSGGGDS